MAKAVAPLSGAAVAAIVKAGKPGKYAVGGAPGLALVIQPSGTASWFVRLRVDGKSTDRRLGSYALHGGTGDALSLAQARSKAPERRVEIRKGTDETSVRRAERAKAAQAEGQAKQKTFAEAARAAYEVKRPTFKNDKHASQWITTLETYAFPTLGARPVAEIRAADVKDAILPIWHEVPETARRTLQRVMSVLEYAEAHEWTDRAPSRGAVVTLLGGAQTAQPQHHAAVPIDGVPRLMKALAGAEGMGARALRFAILTAARSGEVRGAAWREIDLQARLWTVPAERMKREGNGDHVVPLSDAAIALLKALPQGEPDDLIFPSEQPGSEGLQMSDMTLSAVIRRLHAADVAAGGPGFTDSRSGRVATPHGVARSSFRDWCSENGVPAEVAERALAHAVGDKTERAYLRTKLIEQRRPVMQAWGAFCVG